MTTTELKTRPRLPEWLRLKLPTSDTFSQTRNLLGELKLHTVCESAKCPNHWECWSKGTATFMIAGDRCTRACGFCAVATAKPLPLEADEPLRVAEATRRMKLKHVVITAVARDDVADGGAEHFRQTIEEVRKLNPGIVIEVLVPDFQDSDASIDLVLAAKPQIFNHNLETVPANYLTVRPGARYFHSIRLLQRVKELDPTIFTKSGIMVGLGEERNEVLQLMDDLRSADVDFLTIGQYLQPTKKHHAVIDFITPDAFKAYETIAYTKGFLLVSSTPLTRSSHHAGDDFAKLRAARDKQLGR